MYLHWWPSLENFAANLEPSTVVCRNLDQCILSTGSLSGIDQAECSCRGGNVGLILALSSLKFPNSGKPNKSKNGFPKFARRSEHIRNKFVLGIDKGTSLDNSTHGSNFENYNRIHFKKA